MESAWKGGFNDTISYYIRIVKYFYKINSGSQLMEAAEPLPRVVYVDRFLIFYFGRPYLHTASTNYNMNVTREISVKRRADLY